MSESSNESESDTSASTSPSQERDKTVAEEEKEKQVSAQVSAYQQKLLQNPVLKIPITDQVRGKWNRPLVRFPRPFTSLHHHCSLMLWIVFLGEFPFASY